MQKNKRCITNTFVKATRKERPSSAINIRNLSKNLSFKRTKITGGYKIATSIDNIVKKLAIIRELQTEPIKNAVKLLISTYSHNKQLLLDGLKLLRDERNAPIFLSFTGKIQRD